MIDWKRSVGQKIRHMTPDDAKKLLAAVQDRTNQTRGTIFHPEIKELTGGYNSQTINAYVIRKLGIKAGYVKNKK